MPASKGLLSDVFRAFQAFQRLKKASVPVAYGIGAAATECSELSQACCTDCTCIQLQALTWTPRGS